MTDEAIQAAAMEALHSLWCKVPKCAKAAREHKEASAVIASVEPLIRQAALQEAGDAIEGERMPRRSYYTRGYDAAICDALQAVRELGEPDA